MERSSPQGKKNKYNFFYALNETSLAETGCLSNL